MAAICPKRKIVGLSPFLELRGQQRRAVVLLLGVAVTPAGPTFVALCLALDRSVALHDGERETLQLLCCRQGSVISIH
jgi:hypothetical protein